MTAVGLPAMQRLTVAALRRGHEGRVPVTLVVEARAESLLRAARAAASESLTVTAVLAHKVAQTLAEHPAMRTTMVDDEHVERHDAVDLGLAVALPDGGLVVPVIKGADSLGLPELAERIVDLARRARTRSLRPTETRNASFTLSSTGNVAVPVVGTPTLSAGQAGVLLASRIAERPVVDAGAIRVGQVMPLSLTFDHLAVNGVPALRFLEALVRRVELDEGSPGAT